MSMVDEVRKKIPPQCLVERCRVRKCSAHAGEEIENPLWVDCDCVSRETRRAGEAMGGKGCDFLFFGEDKEARQWVAAIEFKEHRPSASTVVPQLQAGGNCASELLGNGRPAEFRPVLVHGGSMRNAEKLRFRDSTVTFRGKKERVRVARKQVAFPLD